MNKLLSLREESRRMRSQRCLSPCVCLSVRLLLSQILNKLTDFYKTWHEDHVIFTVHFGSISSIITNKCTFRISVTLLPYICFGCGPAIITVH
jgi:hypothetical protein